MKANCILKILVILLFIFNFNYLHASPLEGSWSDETYIDNNEIPYSIFQLN